MQRRIIVPVVLLLLLLLMSGFLDSLVHQPDMSDTDIYYSFVEGQRLLNGENPYARILGSDMLTNNKYATYFPLFYELSFVSQKLGLAPFDTWLAFWRIVFIVFEFGIAVLMFWALARRDLPWVGLFAAAFWLFDRWTLQLLQVSNLDFVPIFFLLLSLELFPRDKWLSLFLFSLSLAVKQIAIFVTPLYLVWLWQSSRGRPVRDVLAGAAIIASVPFVASIPFLVWDARAFIYSVLFSVTRASSQATSLAPSVGAFAGDRPNLSRIIMGGLMLMIYVFAWRMRPVRYVFAFLIMLTFVCFNPVLYVQYILWTIPLGLLVLCDVRDLMEARGTVGHEAAYGR
jgi:NADH:ubiquinone oxidoreductase subunit 3 (subunit A)